MSSPAAPPLLTATDQLGRLVKLPFPPQRIVSLVPSQTELLFDLGLGARVVGVTKFCVHPAAARQQAAVVGGTKQFDVARIDALQPDLIIGNKEENYEAGISELARRYPVWLSDIADLAAALAMIREVGALTGAVPAATNLAAGIDAAFAALPALGPAIPAAYFIWRRPYLVAAGGTFINDMLRRAGFTNVFGALGRYPAVSPEQLRAAAPARIFLSSEPYPFGEKHQAEFQALCPAARVQVVDGELFSWYGSRLQLAASYFGELAKS